MYHLVKYLTYIYYILKYYLFLIPKINLLLKDDLRLFILKFMLKSNVEDVLRKYAYKICTIGLPNFNTKQCPNPKPPIYQELVTFLPNVLTERYYMK